MRVRRVTPARLFIRSLASLGIQCGLTGLLCMCSPARLSNATVLQSTPTSGPTPPVVVEASVLKLVQASHALSQQVVLIPATLQGRRVSLILDTGAQLALILSPKALAQIGLPVPSSETVDSLTLGTDRLRNLAFWRTDQYFALLARTPSGWPPIVGVAGSGLLSHYDLVFDGSTNRVRLYRPPPSSASWLPPGVTPADCQPLDTATQGADVVLALRVNGHPVHALFDAGADRNLTIQAVADTIGISERMPHAHRLPAGSDLWGFVDDGTHGWAYAAPVTIEVGALRMATEVTVYPYTNFEKLRGPWLNLGLEALAGHRLFISHATDQVCLAPAR